jgi:hypothetical protein
MVSSLRVYLVPFAFSLLRLLRLLPVLGLGWFGCERHPHPWDEPDAGGSRLTETPPPPIASHSRLPQVDGGPGAGELETPALPVRVGGPSQRCYGGFHPSGEPVKDVTRLSLLCGPENGMKRLSASPLEGAVAAGGPPVTEAFEAHRGECYRIFAVAAAGVGDLDVVVRSSRGTAIAADHGEDAWPIVQPDRPFCALEDDRYTVEVSAQRGSGRFAAELWGLKISTPRP